VQVAYALDLTGDPLGDVLFRFKAQDATRQENWGEFSQKLISEMVARRRSIDTRLRKGLKNWRLERLSTIDRAILRLALCEMMAFDEIPVRVTINEYVELSHAFGSDDSPAFINGVLDSLAKDFPDKDFQMENEEPEETLPEDI